MEIVLTLAVVALALVGFITEILPADIIAFMVMVTLMVLGLVTPEEGISGFGNSATITVMAMFVLSAGIARTGAIQIVRDALIRWGGKTPTRQTLVMGGIVGPITAFINNTAVVAVFLPIVEEWCQRCGVPASKLMIPLSYATILGGLLTTIGTSTNVLASGLSAQLGYGEFHLFQFTKLGIAVFLAGLAYLSLVASRQLPDRQSSSDDGVQGYGLRDYVSEVAIARALVSLVKPCKKAKFSAPLTSMCSSCCATAAAFPSPSATKCCRLGIF